MKEERREDGMIEKVVLSGVINPSENLPVSNMYDTERGGACVRSRI